MIKKVAIIGGGPAGLVSAYELSQKNQWDIVGFEAKDRLGGVWSDSPGYNLESSSDAFTQLRSLGSSLAASPSPSPEMLFQENSPLFSRGDSGVPDIKPLMGTSRDKPLRLERRPMLRDGLVASSKTGVYAGLLGNVPGEFVDFYTGREGSSTAHPRADLEPLVTLEEIQTKVEGFVSDFSLEQYYRQHTTVEFLDKLAADKWILVAKRSLPDSRFDEWYAETFDAVVVANGHYQVPYIPFYMSKPTDTPSNIHEYNRKYPGNLVHVRDIDMWYAKAPLASPPRESLQVAAQRIVIVGKSFSCMDILKRLVPLKRESPGLEIIISTNTPPLPDNKANPFYWFDEWLVRTADVSVHSQIAQFVTDGATPTVRFQDGAVVDNVANIIFATGYVYCFPFVSPRLLENYKIFVTPDPRNLDQTPSNISRVTGLYLHTLSIADPTMGFVGISSNTNFRSFHISAKVLEGVWSRFNKLCQEQSPKDAPYYDSVWSQVLPTVEKQLEWSKKRLSQTGNNGAYHFYYPTPVLQEHWLSYCQELFGDSTADHAPLMFPDNSVQLSQQAVARLRALFLESVGDVAAKSDAAHGAHASPAQPSPA